MSNKKKTIAQNMASVLGTNCKTAIDDLPFIDPTLKNEIYMELINWLQKEKDKS